MYVSASAALLVASCSVQRVPMRDPAATPRSTDTDTGSSSTYSPQAEAPSPPPPAVAPAPASATSDEAPTLEVAAPANLETPAVSVQDLPAQSVHASPSAGPGYRVQVFAGKDSSVAERVRAEVEARTGTRAYVTYQAPFYKVRAGDCSTSDACRDLQVRLRDLGYDTVWVVPDQIAP
jgi:cell division protein FtsN